MVHIMNNQMCCLIFLITINKYVYMSARNTKDLGSHPKRAKRYNNDFDAYSPYSFNHYPQWKPEPYGSHSFHGQWGQDSGHYKNDYYDFQNAYPFHGSNDYDSPESEEEYPDIPLQKTPFKKPIKKFDYPEQSIPDIEIPEPSNDNKEVTSERASIMGKPVIVPPDEEANDQIIFQDTSLETPEQRTCVQDCSTTSEYNPVCGTNNVTYFNTGKFKCARDCGVDVFIKFYGRCPGATSVVSRL